jgi:acyl-CoA synthetase (AMP-forming)/AMP-acid ligase II
MPIEVVETALRLMPDVDFVNAYGLTETSSTVSVLGPEDHRAAVESDDQSARARLGSVGRPLPDLQVEIRDDAGVAVPAGERGEIWVHGEQVAGEYQEAGSVLVDGWFPTRDAGRFDGDGYLYIEGRVDDVIVRGGENLSPGEIEAVLTEHPSVADAAVVGVPDVEWGEAVVAAVVCLPGAEVGEVELQDLVRSRLRSTRTPERIAFVEELPHNETGKLLRRVLREDLAD